MSFSNEWEILYRSGVHDSIWPWSDLVSLVSHYCKEDKKYRVLELGCGAGANIPFFISKGMSYFGIDGSETEVKKLCEKFRDDNVRVILGDFTKTIPLEGNFDIIIDRAAVTHNTTSGIKKTMDLVWEKLAYGGYFFGVDWFSSKNIEFTEQMDGAVDVDKYTKKFSKGFYSGLGNSHFSDEDHLRELFSKFEIVEMFEKTKTWVVPKKNPIIRWNVVARKTL